MRTVINEQGVHRGFTGEGITIEGSRVDIGGVLFVRGIDVFQELKRLADLVENLSKAPTQENVQIVETSVAQTEPAIETQETVDSIAAEAPVVVAAQEKPVKRGPPHKNKQQPTA